MAVNLRLTTWSNHTDQNCFVRLGGKVAHLNKAEIHMYLAGQHASQQDNWEASLPVSISSKIMQACMRCTISNCRAQEKDSATLESNTDLWLAGDATRHFSLASDMLTLASATTLVNHLKHAAIRSLLLCVQSKLACSGQTQSFSNQHLWQTHLVGQPA